MFEILRFLVATELAGVLAYPLLSRVFEDSYSLSKPIGLALLTTVTIVLSLLFDFYTSVLVSTVILILAFAISLRRRRIKPDKNVLEEELVFVLAFALAVFYLSFKPEIYYAYSEDFTDFAFLKSILRFGVPLRDPWFGGEFLRYYFFGHVVSASLIVLSGVKPEVGYNLAVATFYALAVQLAYWLGKRIAKNRLYGIFSAIFVNLLGFFSGFLQLTSFLFKVQLLNFKPENASLHSWLLHFDSSASTRLVPGAIVFYPFFTFLQGDMHAHFMSIPFQLAVLGIAYMLYERFTKESFLLSLYLLLFLSGLHTWSVLPCAFALLLTCYCSTKNRYFIYPLALFPAALVLLLFNGSIGIVDVRTSFLESFLVFAPFFVVTFLYSSKALKVRELFIAALFVPIGLALNFQLLFLFPLAIFLLRKEKFEDVLMSVALLTLLFCELFFFNDPLGKPFERMNTVMKLYISVWIFWGFSSSLLLSKLERKFFVLATIFIALSLVHPLASLISMPNNDAFGKTEKLTLDGMEWLREKHPDEFEAIKWLENKSGVVLEAPGDAYTYSSRVSTFTGLPTVLGWRTHEIMWGRSWSDVDSRGKDVDEIYLNGSLKLIEKYGIRYIFFGEVEKERYNVNELDYPWLKVVFKRGNVTIYEVSPDSAKK